jgi:serine/threonine protein kinase
MNSLPDVPQPAGKASMGGLSAGQSAGGGRYLLKKILGHGGMSVVWLAHDRLLREAVALKFLPPQIACDPAALEGLRRETLRSRRLSHPHIVRIHDLVDVRDEPIFISMEYVDGPNLHALRARRHGRVLTWEFLEPLVRQLCAALEYAHDEKVIHRDLKPANLMLDSNDRLKLADFGLSRMVSDSMSVLSNRDQTSGTLGYMSPQQGDGRKPQITDDVYSLGATLYELVTSTPPFHSGDIGYQLRHVTPDPLEQRLADLELTNEIPAPVTTLILACLAKEPEQRPQSAKAILQWLDGGPQSVTSTVGDEPKASEAVVPEAPRAPVHSEPSPGYEPPPSDFFPAAVADRPPETTEDFSPAPSPHRIRFVWVAAALLLAAGASALSWYLGQRAASNHVGRHAVGAVEPGFERLFNGRDLKGWDGDPNLWYVRDGAIFAFASEDMVKHAENSCLIWREPVANFELRLRFRLLNVMTARPANSGLMYRGRQLPNWQVRGYQADLQGDNTGTLVLTREDGRDPRVNLGQRALIKTEKDLPVIKPKGTAVSADQLKNLLQKDEWNDLVVVAQGNHFIHQVNGVVTAEVLDESTPPSPVAGCLALELKRASSVQFKDIRLKRLPNTPAKR